jgi:peptidyl-tRNA hydrolase
MAHKFSVYSYIGKKVFFGCGHYAYPDTRYSVGCKVINDMADLLGIDWKDNPDAMCFTAESEHHFLVKPKHFKENGVSLSAFLHNYHIPKEEVVVVHDDVSLPVGSYSHNTEPDIDAPTNYWLLSINNCLGGHLNTCPVGIGPVGDFYDVRISPSHPLETYTMENQYFRNVFTDKEMALIEKLDLPTILLEKSYADLEKSPPPQRDDY